MIYSLVTSARVHCTRCNDVFFIPLWNEAMDRNILQRKLHCPHCGHWAVPKESHGTGLEPKFDPV